MKKTSHYLKMFFLAISLSLFSEAFSENSKIYVQNLSNTYNLHEFSEYFRNGYFDKTWKNFKTWASENSIEIVEVTDEDLVFYDEDSIDEKIDRLTNQKNKILNQKNELSKIMNFVTIKNSDSEEDFDEAIARIDREIESIKNSTKPAFHYPLIRFNIDEMEYSDKSGYNFTIGSSVYFSENVNTDLGISNFRFDNTKNSNTEKSEIVEKYLESVTLKSLETYKSSVVSYDFSQNAPEYVDSIDLNSTNTSIAAFENGNYASSTKNDFTIYSENNEVISSIKRNGDDSSFSYLTQADGKYIYSAKPGSESIEIIDEKGKVVSKKKVHFTNSFFPSISPEGNIISIINPTNITYTINSVDNSEEKKLTVPPYTMKFCFAGNGKIWFMLGCEIFIYSTDGKLLDVKTAIIPGKTDMASGYLISKVFEDDSFILQNGENFYKFGSDSNLEWTKSFDDHSVILRTCMNGTFYFQDTMNKKLLRYEEKGKSTSTLFTKLIQIQKKAEKENLALYKKYLLLADAYFSEKGYKSAFEYYSSYMSWCPADAATNDKMIQAQVHLLLSDAEKLSEETFNTYDEYGEETARPFYQEAMKTLEKLTKLVPWNEEALKMKKELKSIFAPSTSETSSSVSKLEIKDVQITALFPCLMNFYSEENPSGSIHVKNNSGKTMKNLKVSAFVRKYMDFPSYGKTVSSLEKNGETALDIVTILNDSVLDVDENTNIQMQFTVSWEEDDQKKEMNITRPVTIFKKSAMNWADTRMLACFILPNDESVSAFAFEHIENQNIGSTLSSNMKKAMLISNALGSIPLNYVSDPSADFSEVISNEYAVDTVRFPFETLEKKGGDCDDMTTLFCSELESAGIPCALITTPGHIFAAFNSKCKINDIWKKLPAVFAYIDINGEAWIPVETTLLSKGFSKAWEKGSEEIQSDEMEFTLVSDAKKAFPGVPTKSLKNVPSIRPATLSMLNDDSSGEIRKVFSAAAKDFVNSLDSKKSKDAAKSYNIAAKIYHSLGMDDEAISTLESALKIDGNYAAANSNLAKLYEIKGNKTLSKEYSDKANSLGYKETHLAVSKDSSGLSRAADASDDIWAE